MMTIQQTIDIPADRWLHLELPKTVPSGKFDLRLIFTPAQSIRERQSGGFAHLLRDSPKTVKEAIAEARQKTAERIASGREPFEESRELLNGRRLFDGVDGVEYQRKIRDEWSD
jgi:hypothetical protein